MSGLRNHPIGSHAPWQSWNTRVWQDIEHDRIDDPVAVAEREKIRGSRPKRAASLFVRFQA